MNDKPIRIAMIMGKWVGGGVEAVIMNYYSHINRKKFQFDFICDEDSSAIPVDKIKKMGGRIYMCPPYQETVKYIKFLKELFIKNKYFIVHSNINTLSVFPLYAAKKAGVPIRIAHNHSTSSFKEIKRDVVKKILRLFSKTYATNYFACSRKAGQWLFGKKEILKGNVTFLPNAIEEDSFFFNNSSRKKIRAQLNFNQNNKVIGHVGRFATVKNHKFIVKIFKHLYKKDSQYRLLLIGEGTERHKIQNKLKKYNLEKVVKIVDKTQNIAEYYQAMDVFVFPSLYEGFGMALIEAQIAGLKCIASKNVPIETKISNNVNYLSIDFNTKRWEKEIHNIFSKEIKRESIECGRFNIEDIALILENKYEEILDDMVHR